MFFSTRPIKYQLSTTRSSIIQDMGRIKIALMHLTFLLKDGLAIVTFAWKHFHFIIGNYIAGGHNIWMCTNDHKQTVGGPRS